MGEQRDPWDKRSEESRRRYRAFSIYRDLGPSRSLQKAWERYAEEYDLQSDQPTHTFREWSVEHDWVARCEQYDRHEERQRKKARKQAREESRQVFVDHAVELAETLVDIATGKEKSNPRQERALQLALDRAGITVPQEIDLDIDDDRSRKLPDLEDKTTAELASIYFEEGETKE